MGIFTGDGRVGRLNYLLTNLVIGVAWVVCVLVLTLPDPETGRSSFHPALIVLFPIVVWASVGNTIRRLHDRDHSGWWWLASCLPLVNLALGLYLLFAPGDPEVNRFGPPPGGQLNPVELEAKRQALEQIQARAEEAQRRAEQSYLREDGSYDMDWMANSVPGLGPSTDGGRPDPA